MDVTTEFAWNKRTYRGLKKFPDVTMYRIARMTLDMTETSIPMSPPGTKTRGQLRRTSMRGGVKKNEEGTYYIGSYTDYASHVWKMPDTTNWTTPGTNNRWYARTIKEKGKTIIDNAVQQSKKEVF